MRHATRIIATEEAEAEPEVRLMIEGGIAVSNAVVVTDNKSARPSVLGNVTADTSEFYGNVTLEKDVTFRAAAGGTVRLTGAVTGAGDIVSDGKDLAFVSLAVCDEQGRVVPTAANRIAFSVEGQGAFVATDNGDERDFSDFHSRSRKAFNGRAQVIVRGREGRSGVIRVLAAAEGLGEASAEIRLRSR